MKKRTLAAMALWTLLGIVSMDSAYAQDSHGDARNTATVSTLQHGVKSERTYWLTSAWLSNIAGEIDQPGDVDYFRFHLSEPATFEMSGPINPSVGFALENREGRTIESKSDPGDDYGRDYVLADLSTGTYYVKVLERDLSLLQRRGAPIELSGRYEMSGELIFSGNDDHSDIEHFETATPVQVNAKEEGTILSNDPGDCFRVDIDRPGTLTVYSTGETDVVGYLRYFQGTLQDPADSDGRDRHNFQIVNDVEPGSYYVRVQGERWQRSRSHHIGPYTLHVEFSASGEILDPPVVRGALRATLLNLSPWQAWVHLYCQKDQIPRADLTTDPCAVTLECGQMEGVPVTWTVDVEPKTVFSYKSGMATNLEATLVAAGKTEAEARRRTTCEVFSPDPLEARSYTRIAGELVPVANKPVVSDEFAPRRLATLIDLSPPQSWVHLYCRKDSPAADAAPADPCAVNLECRQEEGDPVSWIVDVAPKTIFSYWPGRTAPDGTSDNLQAALIATGKTEEETRRRTTCEVSSPDPVAVRGYPGSARESSR